MKRKIILIFLTSLVVFSIVGCGAKINSQNENYIGSDSETAGNIDTADSENKSEDEVVQEEVDDKETNTDLPEYYTTYKNLLIAFMSDSSCTYDLDYDVDNYRPDTYLFSFYDFNKDGQDEMIMAYKDIWGYLCNLILPLDDWQEANKGDYDLYDSETSTIVRIYGDVGLIYRYEHIENNQMVMEESYTMEEDFYEDGKVNYYHEDSNGNTEEIDSWTFNSKPGECWAYITDLDLKWIPLTEKNVVDFFENGIANYEDEEKASGNVSEETMDWLIGDWSNAEYASCVATTWDITFNDDGTVNITEACRSKYEGTVCMEDGDIVINAKGTESYSNVDCDWFPFDNEIQLKGHIYPNGSFGFICYNLEESGDDNGYDRYYVEKKFDW